VPHLIQSISLGNTDPSNTTLLVNPNGSAVYLMNNYEIIAYTRNAQTGMLTSSTSESITSSFQNAWFPVEGEEGDFVNLTVSGRPAMSGDGSTIWAYGSYTGGIFNSSGNTVLINVPTLVEISTSNLNMTFAPVYWTTETTTTRTSRSRNLSRIPARPSRALRPITMAAMSFSRRRTTSSMNTLPLSSLRPSRRSAWRRSTRLPSILTRTRPRD
jgi:hypothetical protein